MSDTSQGAGWWLASDGKWYAPELASPPPPPPQQQQLIEAAAVAERPASTAAHSAPTFSGPPVEASTMPTNGAAHTNATPQKTLVSDVSLGEGWWQGTDEKWYAPEVYPSNTRQGDGWWQAGANGRWYAPMFHPSYASRSASDVFLGAGWWHATDGMWYPPEVYPSNTAKGEDWWQATDGRWYAPMFRPDIRSVRPPDQEASDAGVGPTAAAPEAGAQTPTVITAPHNMPTGATIPLQSHPQTSQPLVPPTSMEPPNQTAAPATAFADGKRLGMSSVSWAHLAALVFSVIGLLLPWATASAPIGSINISGINSGPGKFLGLIVLLAAATAWWRLLRTNRINGVLSIILWAAIAVFSVAEIVHDNSVFAHAPGITQVGVGLYLNAIAGFVGLGSALVAHYFGHRQGRSSYRTRSRPVGPSGPQGY